MDGHCIPLPWFLSHQLLSHTKNLPSISNSFVYASFRTYVGMVFVPLNQKWVPKNRAEKPPARTKSSATIQTNSLLDMGISRKVKERKPHLDSSSRNRNHKWIIRWRSNWPWLFYSIRWSQNSQAIFLGIKISVYKFSGNVPCFSFRWKLRAQPEIPPSFNGKYI